MQLHVRFVHIPCKGYYIDMDFFGVYTLTAAITSHSKYISLKYRQMCSVKYLGADAKSTSVVQVSIDVSGVILT